MYQFLRRSTLSSIHSFSLSFIRSFIHSFIRSFVLSPSSYWVFCLLIDLFEQDLPLAVHTHTHPPHTPTHTHTHPLTHTHTPTHPHSPIHPLISSHTYSSSTEREWQAGPQSGMRRRGCVCRVGGVDRVPQCREGGWVSVGACVRA
eukprot:GHVU01089945.1.p1 GENE.GHVU01089945.1~~GHVU01089945.1.p1  ORF type:complete len:146 (-),score=0.35 GHVU01089945.1:34-471(-)